MKKERFFVWLPCKLYTKIWFVKNFSKPDPRWPEAVNIAGDKMLSNMLRDKLCKPSLRYEKRMAKNSKYTEKIPIEISADTFYRHGWQLTATDINDFNQAVEQRIKKNMLQYLELSVSFGLTIADAIKGFYDQSGFNDITFPTDSIRKYYLRHRNHDIVKNNVISKQINIIFMENVSHK